MAKNKVTDFPADNLNSNYRNYSREKLDAQRQYLSDRSTHRNYVKFRAGQFGIMVRLFAIITAVILFVSIMWRLRGGDDVLSFSGFLEWLSNLNSVEIDIGFIDLSIGGNWGWFDFFRNFLNLFSKVFGVLVWLCGNIINVLLYLISFLRFLFVG